jgi:L-alanine-DL-glutamate epimerase-like enolase superfamily enzyme
MARHYHRESTRRIIDDNVKLKKFLPTEISGGEGAASRTTVVEWMDRGAYDIVQPGCDDVSVTERAYTARTRAKVSPPKYAPPLHLPTTGDRGRMA